MRTWAKGTSRAAVLAAGFVALGAIPVNASADITDGRGSVLGGNQVNAPVSAPVDVSGNAASLVGASQAASKGGATVRGPGGGGGGQTTSGAGGVGSGNQVNAPVSVPVNVCGNAVAVVGAAAAGCEGGSEVLGGGADEQSTDGTGSVLGGNQLNAPISVPVNVCGNAVAVVGAALAGCEGGSHVKNGGLTGAGQQTSGVAGVGSGNQANVPISVPVDVCGNSVGNAMAGCEGGASVRNGGHGTGRQITSGAAGVVAGNQANAPISIPVDVCGNAAAVVGAAVVGCEGGTHVRSSSGGSQATSGAAGVIAGNQGNAPVEAPTGVCGNAAAVVGASGSACEGGHGVYPYHRAGGGGDLLPLKPPSLSKGLKGAGSAKPQREAGVLPRSEGAPVALSLLGAQAPVDDRGPGKVNGRGGTPAAQSLTKGLPVVGGLARGGQSVTGGLPEAGSVAKGLPKVGAKPVADGLPRVNGQSVTAGPPKVNGVPGPGGLSAGAVPGAGGLSTLTSLVGGQSPVDVGAQRDGRRPRPSLVDTKTLPRTGDLTRPVGVKGVASHRTAQESEKPRTLPAVQKVPGVPGGEVLPATPVVPLKPVAGGLAGATGGLSHAVGGASGGLNAATQPVTGASTLPATDAAQEAVGLGQVKRVAAQEAVADGTRAGTVWTLVASAMLAALAGGVAWTRRTRLGRG